MTCAQVKRNLPLLAGGDLQARLERKTLAHINACPLCRRELEEYRSTLARVKAAAREEGMADWAEADWKALMGRIAAEKGGKARAAWGVRLRWASATAVAAVAILVASAILFRSSIFKSKEGPALSGPEVIRSETAKTAPEKPKISPPARQETRTVPLIQPEYFAKSGGKAAPPHPAKPKSSVSQDVLSVHMVSRETGLQVVWFFDKNFEWKGDGK